MSCKIHIKVYEAKNVLNIDNIPSNPYVKFSLKGKPDSAVKTKTIYNTLNPSWNQELDIVSEDSNSDILQVCMYTEDNQSDYPLTNVYDYPLRYRIFGEHFVFNDQIEKQKNNAGTLHFELDFFIYPEIPLNRDQDSNQNQTQNNNKAIQSNLQTDIIALKKENDEIKAQFQDVVNENSQQISEIKEDLLALKKENEKLLQTIQEKSDTTSTENNDSNISSPNDEDDKSPIENQTKSDTTTEKDDTNFFITNDDEEKLFETDEMIKDGKTSILYKMINKETCKTVCKRLLKIDKNKTTLKNVENIVNEFKTVFSLHHPCLCEAIGINTTEIVKSDSDDEITTISMFFEFCPNSLKNLLEKKVIDNTLKTKIVVEIAHALLYIHNQGLIYRDLKVDNVMLNSIFEAKMIDFNWIKIKENLIENFLLSKSQFETKFLSPELLAEKEYDFKTDVYSFGVLVYFIFSGNLPKIEGQKIVVDDQDQSISQYCIQLVSRCLSLNPGERPDFNEILDDMRNNSFSLAVDIDVSIISKRDEELKIYDNNK